MKTVVITALVAVVCTAIVNTADATGPELTPGKWTFTTTISMSAMPQPRVQTTTKCVTAEEAKADPLGEMIEGGKCKTLSRKESRNSIEFEVECSGNRNVKSRGTGSFTVDGNTASGHMEVEMTMPRIPNMPKMQGLPSGTLTMTQQWSGKRTGDCD